MVRTRSQWSIALVVALCALWLASCSDGTPPEVEAEEHRAAGYEANSRAAWRSAVDEFTQAIELDPMPEDYIERAYAHGNRGDSDLAIADLTEAIALDGESAAAYSQRALNYNDQGLWEEAIADLDRAIELRPDRVDQYNGRAFAYINLGETEAAIADWGTAIALDPDGPLAWLVHSNRARALLDLGDFEAALQDAERSRELNPDNGTTYLLQAAALSALDQPDEARATLEAASELVLDSVQRSQIKAALAALDGDE